MHISRAKLFDIVTRLAHFKYHETYPDMASVINSAVEDLEWVTGENSEDDAKSDTLKQIRNEYLYNIKMDIPQNKAAENAAKAVFDHVFFRCKREFIGWELYQKVQDYLSEVIKSNYNYKDYIDSGLLDYAIDDFIKYYDPSYGAWKTFASDRLKKTFMNRYKHDNRCDSLSPVEEERNDDTAIPSTSTLPDESSFGDSTGNIMKLDMADFLCDIMKRADKDTKPAVYKQFRCFFTFQIAEWIELNDFVYSHVRQHRNSYDTVVDIDFLNHYIDYDCKTITDAYGKERKPLSAFSENGNDTPCNTLNVNGDPPQVIYTSYLGNSAASVSQNYKKYKAFIREAMCLKE